MSNDVYSNPFHNYKKLEKNFISPYHITKLYVYNIDDTQKGHRKK